MLLYWCWGFIAGGMIGATSDALASYPWWRFLSLGLLAALALEKVPGLLRPGALTLAGLIWGLCHHAPSPLVAEGSYVLRSSGLFAHSYQSVMVSNGQRVIQAYAAAETGCQGTLRGTPYRGMLRQARTIFQCKIPPTQALKRWYHPVNEIFFALRSSLDRQFAQHQGFIGGWLEAVFLGRLGALSPQLSLTFKRLGLLHLLVISGFHITFLSTLLRYVWLLPLVLAYSLRLITPRVLLRGKILGELFLGVGLLLFICLIGQPASAQRAFLIFLAAQLLVLLLGKQQAAQQIALVFFCQSLIFPLGLICESAAMSWVAYLLVINKSSREASWQQWLIKELVVQAAVILLSGFLWGQLSLVSLLTNVLIAPFFSPIILASFLLLFSPLLPGIINKICGDLILSSLQFLCWVDSVLVTYCPWQYWQDLPFGLRCLFLVASTYAMRLLFRRGQNEQKHGGSAQSRTLAR